MDNQPAPDHIFNARCLMRTQHTGVLSTVSLSLKGYPFGSVTPYWMTDNGDLILYASDIAQHSRNMKADSKVSLCVFDSNKDDSQANARVTVIGDASVIGSDCEEAESYFTLYPQARAYVNAHDFQFYRITPTRIRYIGGFGEIHWFKPEDWHYATPEWVEHKQGMIDHMHEDHKDALALMLDHQYGVKANENDIEMLNTCIEGFHVNAAGNVYFIKYDSPCLAPQSVRPAMVKLTHAARRGGRAQSVA